jgi:hypothetical protein
MKAKDERPHDANATDSPVDSDVPTHVSVDDDVVEVRQSSKTVKVDDDVVKLASQLSPANKVRLLELLTNKSNVVHLDDVSISSLPEGALPLSEFVEVVMPGDNCLCGVNALKVFLSVILGKLHAPQAGRMREMLFEILPMYFHVPIVNDMTYAQWALAHDKSAENMLQEELRQLGLSNYLLAMIAYMHNVDLDLYNLCINNPHYIILRQSSRVKNHSVGLMEVLWRGQSSPASMGHYNLLFRKDSDAISHVDTFMSSFESSVIPPKTIRTATYTPRVVTPSQPPTPTPTPRHGQSSSWSPLVASSQHAPKDFEQDTFMNSTMSLAACNLLRENCGSLDFGITVQYGKTSTTNKLTFNVMRQTKDGKLKATYPFFGHFETWNGRRMSSLVPVKELTPDNYFIDGKSYVNIKLPMEYSEVFEDLDNKVASFLFDASIDPTRQPKIANMLNTLKQSAKSLEDFRDKLYKLNGAGKCLDHDILPTQFLLIGKPVHTGVRFPPKFTSVNPAMAYAQEHSLEFFAIKGQALHSDGSISEITAENSAAYSRIDGLDDHRGIFAVVAFEGVLNFNYKGNLYLRVVPHLLRYTLLDVDTTMPMPFSHFTPSKEYNGRPVDDYDD